MLQTSQPQPDTADRLQKLISSQKLAFIPNLYYQQYRLLDMLAASRAQYPEQKILVRKEPTTHEYLLCEMRKNQFVLQEELKYRKAMCFHLAKNAREEVIKKKLKKQQKYLFHRIAFSQLAEAVKTKYQQNRKPQKQPMPTPKDKAQAQKQPHRKIKSKISDDIFLDKQESEVMAENLLDDLFDNAPRVEEVQERVQVALPAFVEDYMARVLTQQEENLEREAMCRKGINRKACLKKINENIRKRIKSKLNSDSEKNLNSATVLITSLIGAQTDPKNGQSTTQSLLIDPPQQNQFLSSSSQPNKQKKKKQQTFQLKWPKQTLQAYTQKNPKFELSKNKNQQNYLTINASRDQKQYERIFAKNIAGREPFPPSILCVPLLESKFRVNQFYNTAIDGEYQRFVRRKNKKAVFEKFREISKFALNDVYSYDSSQPSNIAKLFLNPQGSLSDRIIYQISSNKIIPISTVYTKSNLTKQQLLLLSFLIKHYLCIFGNNWKIITTLILTHPNFSNMYLSMEQIQELYQIVRGRDRGWLGRDGCGDGVGGGGRKMLPCGSFGGGFYQVFGEGGVGVGVGGFEEMTDQSEEREREKEKDKDDGKGIDLNDYQTLLNQPLETHENPPDYIFKNTAKSYQQYCNTAKIPLLHEPTYYLGESLSTIIEQFEGKPKEQTKYLENKDPVKFNQCSDWVLEKVKNQIKFNTPIRKKKNITDKSSQLVKILHNLKQRLVNPPKAPVTGTRVPPTQMPAEPVKAAVSQAPVSTPTPTPPETQTMKKTLPKPKPEDRKQKSTVQKEVKQRKKKPGKDDKDADKDQDSK